MDPAIDASAVPKGLTTEGLLSRRYGARVIDNLILLVVAAILVFPISMFLSNEKDSIVSSILLGVVVIVVSIAYQVLLESSPWQATLGKKWLGLKVFDLQGGRLSPQKALLRTLVKETPFYVVALLPIAQPVQLAWLLCHVIVVQRSPVSQAIHDRVVGTWVAAPKTTIQLGLND